LNKSSGDPLIGWNAPRGHAPFANNARTKHSCSGTRARGRQDATAAGGSRSAPDDINVSS
jgi:hypothetical protein